MTQASTVFTSEAQLRELLGHPMELAARKAIPFLDKYCKAFIERAPFLTLATANEAGKVDVSPRGDQPGFALILDDNTLFLPERPGNARYDSLVNIIENPHVGLLFFVPGFEDMLRVNGRATLIYDAALMARCVVNGKAPKIGIRVQVEEAYLHCAKALKRSQLWSSAAHRDRKELPSLGQMVLEQTAAANEAPTAEIIRTVDEYIEDNYRTELY
ncbi:MAG: pyridoxamine 5'-phosphate oxidase family protein [Betaproteobacteria bacterium]|nr:pyridoxamine 5'-phosphate oxidase family protein [Betaproteobacteria bacterium]